MRKYVKEVREQAMWMSGGSMPGRKNKHTGAEEGAHPVCIRIAKRPPG